MEFRRKDHDDSSAFSRPLLPPTSSLLPNRGGVSKLAEVGNGIISSSSGDGGIGDGNQNAADSSSSPAAAAASATRYRECLRNHAASLGGHVLDGCCEFMPGGSSADDALKCAACGCHRSFHRKECPDGGNLTPNSNSSSFYHGRVVPNGSPSNVPLLLPPPHPHHHSITPQLLTHRHRQKQQQHPPQLIPPGFVGFTANSGGGTTTESSSEERNLGPAGAPPQRQFASAPKKRHRTKFTPEQKNKLLGFAERVGWRIQKQDEAAVEAFCAEAAVSRQVLKVWMHNNKHTLRKQQPQPQQEQQLYQQLHHQEVHHQEVEEDVCED